MAEKTIYIDIAVGLAAGLIATKVSDQAQRALWEATPESEKAREPDMEVSSAHSAARLLCKWLGVEPTEREIRLLKTLIHFGLGASWATTYVLFRRYAGLSPSAAASATGTSLALIIDEGINPALGITPPFKAYPASAHLRGLATHLVYGAAVAVADEALQRVIKRGLPLFMDSEADARRSSATRRPAPSAQAERSRPSRVRSQESARVFR